MHWAGWPAAAYAGPASQPGLGAVTGDRQRVPGQRKRRKPSVVLPALRGAAWHCEGKVFALLFFKEENTTPGRESSNKAEGGSRKYH